MRAPEFWFAAEPRWQARLLAPLGWLYARATARRLRARPEPAGAPAICVGNVTAGGSGKTPLACTILQRLQAAGRHPAAVTRGHGGRAPGPRAVHVTDSADVVGDEALLLARHAPTWLGRDRLQAARHAVRAGADVLVLDDGLQNPQPAKALSLLVLDGAIGIGNGRCLPAGPLREPLEAAAGRCQAAMINGADQSGLRAHLPPELPSLAGEFALASEAIPSGPLVAFAGIGRPTRFFDDLSQAGGQLIATQSFADHEPYTQAKLAPLAQLAQAHGGQLVTTEKDHVRLPTAWQSRVTPIPGAFVVAGEAGERLDALLAAALYGAGAGRTA